MMKLSILHFPFFLLAATAIAADPAHSSPMARIQRRATSEAATAQNAVGELTYSIDEPGAAVLRVGTSDSGTVVVSDPCAIHIAPRRQLDPGEFAIRVSGAHTTNPDGSIVLATNVLDVVVTNSVTISPVDPAVKISSVTWDLIIDGASKGVKRETTEEAATLTVAVTSQDMPLGEPPELGMALLKGVKVWVWASDRRTVELDTETHPVPFRDRLGSTSLWDLRSWTTNRYDWRTAEHWAEFAAMDTLRLAGHTVHYTTGGSLRSSVDSGVWTYYASGVPVIQVVAGVSTNSPATEELKILAIDVSDEATGAVIDVSASLGVPVFIDSCNDLETAEWTRATGQTSTYPVTVQSAKGLPAYRVTVPIDPTATRCFYRAAATIDGEGATRTIKIGGESTAIYIDGQRCAWTNITVSGATLRVLAAQPD